MPLSEPVSRKPLHRRVIECHGYRRDDGLWDIEAHLVDTKSYGFNSRERGDVPPGEPVHDMWIRLTIDGDMMVREAEAATDYSPFRICGQVNANFSKLVGLKIGPGWTRKVATEIGGVRGCTHLVELLRPIATTAYQSLVGERGTNNTPPGETPRHINGCHALSSDGNIVKLEWPEHYTGR